MFSTKAHLSFFGGQTAKRDGFCWFLLVLDGFCWFLMVFEGKHGFSVGCISWVVWSLSKLAPGENPCSSEGTKFGML